MNQRMIVAALLLATACGKGNSKDKPAGGTGAAPGTGTAAAGSGTAATPPATPPAAAGAAKVEAGKPPPRGCFGWSSTARAAACLTGSGEYTMIRFLGSDTPAIPAPATFDASLAAGVNDVLTRGGYTALPAATAVEAGKPATMGAVTLNLSDKVTDPGGENVAPTHALALLASCGGKDVELYTGDVEGGSLVAAARAMGDRIVVEWNLKVAREGEQSETGGAAVLDTTACTAVIQAD
jgi:hypothetical protein